jgi:hypothetical protein
MLHIACGEAMAFEQESTAGMAVRLEISGLRDDLAARCALCLRPAAAKVFCADASCNIMFEIIRVVIVRDGG